MDVNESNHPPQQEHQVQSKHQHGHVLVAVTASDVPSDDMSRLAAPDPLLNMTGSGGKMASTFDANHFFDCGTKLPSVCKFCCVQFAAIFTIYSKSTAMTTLHLHIKRFHLCDYLDLALQEGRDWPIQLKVMKECTVKGYSLQELKSLVEKGIHLKSLPPHPVGSTSNPGSGTAGADNRGSTPPFSFAMFHKLLVNFIVTDDQSLHVIECEEFWCLLLLLKNDLKDNNIPHCTKIKSDIIQGWKDYFAVLKTDLQFRKALAHTILYLLNWAGVTMKAGHFSMDNAKNNIAMMDHLAELLNEFTAANVADDLAQARHDNAEDKQEYIDAMRGNPLNCAHSTICAIHASGVQCDEFSSLIANGNKGQWFKSLDGEMIIVPDLKILHDVKT
ncbi:hypothetical protein EDD16DRAFT_1521874 [Pisolithus croceorrhizus]|nr:hypothetical protein EDD16DRAFT_1521874 [Pisolithus croceorrhizus]